MATPSDHPAVSREHLTQVVAQFLGRETMIAAWRIADGGFSAAHVQRVETSRGVFAVRRFPREVFPQPRIAERHRFLGYLRSHGVPVAVPLQTASGQCVYDDASHWWQMEPWLPGESVSGESMAPAQVESVMRTLARLHLVAQTYRSCQSGDKWFVVHHAPCPSVSERRAIIDRYAPTRLVTLREAVDSSPDRFRDAAIEVVGRFIVAAPTIDCELRDLERVPVPIHPCWRDLWSAHILFTGETVSGMIDPTAARTDHVATDLSRLLGSLFGDEYGKWELALKAYEDIRRLSDVESRLLRAMDRSAVLLSGLTWLERWAARSIPDAKLLSATARLERIRQRLTRLVETL